MRWLLATALVAVAAVGLAPSRGVTMPDVVRIPVLKPREKGDPPDAARFSHWEHGRYYCYTCHPSVFPQRRVGFTHEDIDAGRFCGHCHDGRTAFEVDDDDVECEACHREPVWTKKWGRP